MALNTTGTFALLNAIQNGSGSTQRIGSKVNLAGVQLKLFVTPLRTTTSLTEMWRLFLVYDRQPNGGAPALADIFGGRDYAAAAITADAISNMMNPDNRDRFTLLWDKRVRPRNATVTGALMTGNAIDVQYMVIDKFIRIPNLPVVYGNSSTPPVIGDIKTGSLYLISIGNVAALSESQLIQGTIRTFFHDDPY